MNELRNEIGTTGELSIFSSVVAELPRGFSNIEELRVAGHKDGMYADALLAVGTAAALATTALVLVGEGHTNLTRNTSQAAVLSFAGSLVENIRSNRKISKSFEFERFKNNGARILANP